MRRLLFLLFLLALGPGLMPAGAAALDDDEHALEQTERWQEEWEDEVERARERAERRREQAERRWERESRRREREAERRGRQAERRGRSPAGSAMPEGFPWPGWACREIPGRDLLECSPVPPGRREDWAPPAPVPGWGPPVGRPPAAPPWPLPWPEGPPTGADPATLAPPAAPAYRIRTPFDEAAFAPYGRRGNASISGEAFVRLPDGGVVLAAAAEVVLVPDTAYTRELLEPARSGRYGGVDNLDPRYFRYRRTVLADANGRFRFSPVPAGSYIVQIGVPLPDAHGRGLPGNTVFLHEEVAVAGGSGANVVLTNRPRPRAQR